MTYLLPVAQTEVRLAPHVRTRSVLKWRKVASTLGQITVIEGACTCWDDRPAASVQAWMSLHPSAWD
jgi:hypothetical protein